MQRGTNTPNTEQEDEVDFEYLEKPKDEFKCPLCLSVLKDVYEIESCGHVFCKSCLFKLIQE